jgi:DNA replication protein DnaC
VSAAPAHLDQDLKSLLLPTIRAQWERIAEQARRARQSHGEYLAELAHLEVTARRQKRIERRVKEARLPVMKTLDAFDFAAAKGIERERVLEVFDCRFVEERSNVVLVGGVGTGKTHLAIALALACCQKERRVRFTTAAEMTNALVEAKHDGRLSRKLEHLARFDVVVLDELGYVPFDKQGADLLFGFITKVYERRSLVVTTNLPFGRWSEVFLDTGTAAAVIDRIVHHATVIATEGESYRLQDANARARRGAAARGQEVRPA